MNIWKNMILQYMPDFFNILKKMQQLDAKMLRLFL